MTVADLAAQESLAMTVLAGNGGLGRQVLWAHSCEMPDPERWMGPHELLMTVGLCIPPDEEGQVGLITRLADAGLAGMTLGDHAPAPRLHPGMLAEADRRDFPVLLVGSNTPYVAIGRTVAAAHASTQTLQVLRLAKLYRVASSHEAPGQLMDALQDLLGVGLRVVDTVTRASVLASDTASAASRAQDARRRDYPLDGADGLSLELSEYAGEQLDSFTLVHLLGVLQVAAGRALATADRLAEHGRLAMRAVMEGESPTRLREAVAPHGLAEGYVVAALDAVEASGLPRALALAGLPSVAASIRDSLLLLVPAGAEEATSSVATALGLRAGVSSHYADPVDVRVAAREAGRVLSVRSNGGEAWARFDGAAVSVLARSHREAREVVREVLGPLAGQGERVDGLRETLFAFLRLDRSWTRTAQELGIHRQTLVYRVRKIEELTGRRLSNTGDVSALWIACQAWEVLHPDAEAP